MNLSRALPIFAIAFAVIYASSVQFNLPLFTYLPVLGEVRFGAVFAGRDTGPVMHWYGWLSTSTIGASTIATMALLLPLRGADRLLPTLAWLVPIVAMVWTTWATAKIWFF
jgi:hypothetical protein